MTEEKQPRVANVSGGKVREHRYDFPPVGESVEAKFDLSTEKTLASVFCIYAEADRRMAARKKLAHRRKLLIWLGGPYLALVMALLAFTQMHPVYAFWLGLSVMAILLFLGKLIRED